MAPQLWAQGSVAQTAARRFISSASETPLTERMRVAE